MLSFRDVVVSPYSDLLRVGPQHLDHQGGPHWPDFDRQREARHQRAGVPVDHEPEARPASERLAGDWAWAGPVTGHFGHQVCEFSMRLVPTVEDDPDARFVFAVPPSRQYATIDAAPQFLREILDWLGIPRSRCHVVARPTVVDALSVVPQAEQMDGPGPTEQHLDAMDELTSRRLGTLELRDTVYVSRAAMKARFAGELSLEEALSSCGVRVVRPETLLIAEQLRTYASARRLIFAEGSAMWAPLLLGRSLADVVVLVRRPNRRLAEHSLLPRAASLQYFDAIQELIPGRNWRGKAVGHAGLTLLDEDTLLAAFDTLEIPLRKHWNTHIYAERRQADVEAHREATS